MAGDTALGHFAVQVSSSVHVSAVCCSSSGILRHCLRVQERQQNSNHTTWICYLGKRRQPNEQIVWTCR
uniref:Uncharacterized protein n=1 Tax=Toxoplasma gondii (strain ATCC 50861 / VEG) TaxID=432359 RepID=A0A0F7V841_TOXGV|nr:TPA: hypothetical protein BN1205_108677 [Toxoplasma gondii VEG]